MLTVRADLIQKDKAAVGRAQELAIDLINRCRGFGGVRMVNITLPMTYNRFNKDIPVGEQLAFVKEGLPPIVRAAQEAGIVLLLANHYDYRAHEIRSVLEHVDSPHLRSIWDLGGSCAVSEDPVEGTKVLAPYIDLVHFKDVAIMPWVPASSGYFATQYTVPLGEGNVDLKRIVQILAEKAVDPDRLVLALETAPVPPNEDEEQWVVEGLKWMRRELSQYLKAGSAVGGEAS